MKKWNLNQEWKKIYLIGGIVFLITILDLIDGSTFRFMEMGGPECLASHLFQISIIMLIVSLFQKKKLRKKIQKWSLVIIVPTILALEMESKIVNYQYERTVKSLNEICLALKNYKLEKGKYPIMIDELQPNYLESIPKSGFGIFDSEIKYELLENGKTHLNYKVKFGFICEAYDCKRGINFSTWARC